MSQAIVVHLEDEEMAKRVENALAAAGLRARRTSRLSYDHYTIEPIPTYFQRTPE